MTDHSLSRRFFVSAAAAAAPAVPMLVASDRIAIFDPPPDKIRIVTAATSFVVPPPAFSPEEIRQIQSQGKNVELTVTKNLDEVNRLLPEVDVVFGTINAEMFARARKLRWIQNTEAGMEAALFPELVKSPVVAANTGRGSHMTVE